MSEPSNDKSKPESERKPTPTQIKILFWLDTHRKFRGSKVQLRKRMGYPSDGSVNAPLRGLLEGKFIEEDASEEGSAYALTTKGKNSIFYLRLPDRLLLVILVVGALDIYVALDELVLGTTPSPYAGLVSGVALLGIFVTVALIRRKLANEFLDIRQPLEESESIPREGRDDDSTG